MYDSPAKEALPVSSSTPYDVLIPWSGGFDSTALILKAIKEKKTVAWCAYTLENNKDQSAAESVARRQIEAYLKSRGIYLSGSVTDTFDTYLPPPDTRYGIPRLIVASTVLGLSAKEVWLGYTRSDQKNENWNFEDHAIMASLIPSLWTLTRTSQPPIVRFPFLDMDKADICREFYPDYRPVFKMLASCQFGYDDARFCNCEKCRKLESLQGILDRTL